MGMGGREVRTGPEYGHIFDHFAVEYEYPSGAHMISMCRQIDGCASRVEEIVYGTEGTMQSSSGWATIRSGAGEWKAPQNRRSPYVRTAEDQRVDQAQHERESVSAVAARIAGGAGSNGRAVAALSQSHGREVAREARETTPLPAAEHHRGQRFG
jgi:predicted dehydrogenase